MNRMKCGTLALAASMSLATIASAGDPVSSTPIQSFGTVEVGFECGIFQAEDGTLYNFPWSPRQFQPGQFVYLEGEVFDCPDPFCGLPCIIDAVVLPAVEIFGTLEVGFECGIFQAQDGTLYDLHWLPGEFKPGQFVKVTAALDEGCVNPFCGLPCLENAVIEPAFHGCGSLVQGFECLILVTATGEEFHIFNAGGFGHGQQVIVTGVVDASCFSFCFLPCLEADFIAAPMAGDLNCDDSVNGEDLGDLLLTWGFCAGCILPVEPPIQCPADLNHDCQIDGADLGQLLLNWTE